MDVFAVGEPQLMDAARGRARSNRKSVIERGFSGIEMSNSSNPAGCRPGCCRLVGDGQDVADRLQRVRAHMRLRQVAAGDDLWRARIADVDRGEVLRRAFMRQPQDAAPVLGDLDRHALADAAEAVELMVRQLAKIPDRGIGHVSTPEGLIGYYGSPWFGGTGRG